MCGCIYSLMKFGVIMLAGWPKRCVRILLTTHCTSLSYEINSEPLLIHGLEYCNRLIHVDDDQYACSSFDASLL
jgi:hypothetical protein